MVSMSDEWRRKSLFAKHVCILPKANWVVILVVGKLFAVVIPLGDSKVRSDIFCDFFTIAFCVMLFGVYVKCHLKQS